MLPGLLFLAALIGFGTVVSWVIIYDAPGASGGTSGLLAMKDYEPDRTDTDTGRQSPPDDHPGFMR